MFENLLVTGNSRWKNARKALTFSLSLFFHAALVVAVIVVPLLRAETELPEFSVIDAALIAPPPIPGIPPSGRPRNTATKPGTPAGESTKPPRRLADDFTVPTEITKSTDEDLSNSYPVYEERYGIVDGIDGVGDEGEWEIGREYVPEAVSPGKGPIINITAPRLIKRVNPDYAPAAIAAHVSGPVVIAAVTDIYGRVREAWVVSGHALLSMSALKAVREWIYEPYLVNGIPKPVSFTVTVTFSLEKR